MLIIMVKKKNNYILCPRGILGSVNGRINFLIVCKNNVIKVVKSNEKVK